MGAMVVVVVSCLGDWRLLEQWEGECLCEWWRQEQEEGR